MVTYLKNSKRARWLAAAALSFGGVCTLPFMLHIGQEWNGYTNSIFSVFLFFLLFRLLDGLLQKGLSDGGARWFWSGLVGGLFSLCMIFGTALDLRGNVPFGDAGMWAGIFIWGVIFTLAVRFLWNLAGKERLAAGAGKGALAGRAAERRSAVGASEKEENESGGTLTEKESRRSLLLRAAVIFLCYLPVFLAVYPGFFVYDAQDEYMQVLTRNFSTHHPLVHVLLLGGIIQIFYKLTGSCNPGIACYTLLQMTVMSLIFSWCVEKLKKRGLGKPWRILLTLYFGLCPVLVMFSLCSAKDGLFTGMLLVAVVLLQEMFAEPDAFFQKKGSVLLLEAASLFMLLLRHNGFYAYLVFAPIGIIYLKKYRKKAALCFGAVVAAYVLINSALAGVFHAESGEHQEMLTVPISQMARVYGDGKETLPAEDRETLYRYLSEEALLRYTPKVSDGVKINFNNEAYEADKGSFLKLWLKWGIEHPFTYLNAWFMTSYGFWYPDTVIDVYRGNTVFTYTYEDSSYFGYEVEQPGVRESKLPWLDEIYRKMSLEIFQQKVPVLSMLFSPGFLFWVMAFCLGFLCDRGRWNQVLPFALPALVWLTVILGPTYLVRYVVFLWALLPVVLEGTFRQGNVPSSARFRSIKTQRYQAREIPRQMPAFL